MTRPSSLLTWGAAPDVPPPGPLADVLHGLLGAFDARCVWRNERGGLTFDVTSRDGRAFAKWAPSASGLPLCGEAERLRWLNDAAPHLPVPRVLAWGDTAGEEASGAGSYLVTAALDGQSAVHPDWLARPALAVRAIGEGLRLLHDSVPVERCPFDWSVTERLRRREQRPDADLAPAPDIGEQPSIDVRVVCHGDPCSPNTLVGADGRFAGLVDLGSMGVADRWADLAVATASATWNYGPEWEQPLLAAYGVDRDDERIAFYRRLWDAT
ncbi:MAG: phosphotransferase [Actinomycetes bacterium]